MNRMKSQELAATIDVRPNDCVGTARKALDSLPDDAQFVMGIAGKHQVAHAWIELKGEILDAAWANTVEDGVLYEPICRLPRSEAMKRIPVPPFGGTEYCGAPDKLHEWFDVLKEEDRRKQSFEGRGSATTDLAPHSPPDDNATVK